MQAINHVATALLLKKAFPKASFPALIIGTEAVEILWVGLNIAGIEHTIIDDPMRSVADIHLIHMPYSHSILANLVIVLAIALPVLFFKGRAALPLALAIASHIILDLAVHAPDIAIAPFMDAPKIGTGLYANSPMLALGVESIWGIFCWWIYRGNWKSLAVILLFGLLAIPSYSPVINTSETALSGQSDVFAWAVFLQIFAASVLIWFFERRPTKSLFKNSEKPSKG